MKTSLFPMTVLIASALLSTAARAGQQQPDSSWIDEATQTVRFVAEPVLRVELIELDAGDKSHGQLNINLEYELGAIANQIQELKQVYPKLSPRRVLIEQSEEFRLRIPDLGIDQAIIPRPGSEGPYVNATLFVNRNQHAKLLTSIRAQRPLVQIDGQVTVRVPSVEVIEEIRFSSDLCQELAPEGSTVLSTVAAVTDFARVRLGSRAVQFGTTRTSVLADIMGSCFSLPQPSAVSSFQDLLKVSVTGARPGRDLLGQTTRHSEKTISHAIQPQLIQQER